MSLNVILLLLLYSCSSLSSGTAFTVTELYTKNSSSTEVTATADPHPHPHQPPFDPSFFVSQIFDKYGDKHFLTYEGFEHLLENLGLGHLTFKESHDVSLHKINGTFYEIHDEKNLHMHRHDEEEDVSAENIARISARKKRHVPLRQKLSTTDELETHQPCLSPQDILLSYGLKPSHGVLISQDTFQLLCPAIVYEMDHKKCWSNHIALNNYESDGKSYTRVWLEASLSIAVMSIAGLLCAAVVPLLNRCQNEGFLQFLVAIAAGTLAGDALIHLLPQALVYEPNFESSQTPIYRATVTLLSILGFFIAECLLRIYHRMGAIAGEKLDVEEEKSMLKHNHSHHQKRGPLACVVITGDILHNMTDGLSVGAAFSVSSGTGLACATAVFCHELPHELGDYAVLLKEGVGVRKALFWNLFSSVFSFGGMAIGIMLGEVFHAAPWVNAFTAGTFLYIALGNLMPELKKSDDFTQLLIQLVGLSCGLVLMFLIGVYEDEWEHILTTST